MRRILASRLTLHALLLVIGVSSLKFTGAQISCTHVPGAGADWNDAEAVINTLVWDHRDDCQVCQEEDPRGCTFGATVLTTWETAAATLTGPKNFCMKCQDAGNYLWDAAVQCIDARTYTLQASYSIGNETKATLYVSSAYTPNRI